MYLTKNYGTVVVYNWQIPCWSKNFRTVIPRLRNRSLQIVFVIKLNRLKSKGPRLHWRVHIYDEGHEGAWRLSQAVRVVFTRLLQFQLMYKNASKNCMKRVFRIKKRTNEQTLHIQFNPLSSIPCVLSCVLFPILSRKRTCVTTPCMKEPCHERIEMAEGKSREGKKRKNYSLIYFYVLQ